MYRIWETTSINLSSKVPSSRVKEDVDFCGLPTSSWFLGSLSYHTILSWPEREPPGSKTRTIRWVNEPLVEYRGESCEQKGTKFSPLTWSTRDSREGHNYKLTRGVPKVYLVLVRSQCGRQGLGPSHKPTIPFVRSFLQTVRNHDSGQRFMCRQYDCHSRPSEKHRPTVLPV